MKFHEKRRQQFLNEHAFEKDIQYFNDTSLAKFLEVLHAPDSDANDRRRASWAIADYTFCNYMLRYTAGEALDVLREDLTTVIVRYEQHTVYLREYAKNQSFPPFRFVEIDEYERVMQLIGLCYLLHRRDLLPRLASMLDKGSGKDTLYEDLLAYEMKGRCDVDEWYHDCPYRDLINSLYRDTPEESIADIEKYLRAWYKSMKKAPWHDSHLNMTSEGCGAYFGYWSMEAGAVAYLLELDDSSFREHIVYPKDLVDYARELDKRPQSLASSEGPGGDMRLRVEGGKSCPQTGYWFTPAKANSRCHFKEGDIMPVYGGSDYGATIWQWSQEQ